MKYLSFSVTMPEKTETNIKCKKFIKICCVRRDMQQLIIYENLMCVNI